MKYRKLRIAWSVAWGIVCLLLIALWVRSHWWFDLAVQRTSSSVALEYGSVEGAIYFFNVNGVNGGRSYLYRWMGAKSPPIGWSLHHVQATKHGSNDQSLPKRLFREFRLSCPSYLIPYWFPPLSAAVLTAAPWLRWRFSLRTLLIGMTVAARGLGWIVYALRK